MSDIHRWNFEDGGDEGVRVCKNLHDKGHECDYEPFTAVDAEQMASRIALLQTQLAAAERDVKMLLDALVQRDGGSHERDCKGVREWGDYVCDCGHAEAQAAIDAARDNHPAAADSTEGVG